MSTCSTFYSKHGRAWSTTCRITITVDGSTNRIRTTNGYSNTKTSISPLGERRTTDEFSKTKQQTLQKVNKNGPYLEYPSFVDVCVARLETMNVFTRSEYFPGTNADDQFDVTAMTLTMNGGQTRLLINHTTTSTSHLPNQNCLQNPAELKRKLI